VVQTLKNKSVIILADHRYGAYLMEELSDTGNQFIIAPDCTLTIKKVEAHKPSAIIVDFSNPEFSLEKLQALLAREPSIRDSRILLIHDNGTKLASEDFSDFIHLDFFQKDDGLIKNLTHTFKKETEPAVKVKFWGVRGSTPTANPENIRYGGNTTCVSVSAPFLDEYIILDSGTGIRNLGNYLENEISYPVKGRIFITHPHWDHIQGFPFFKPFYRRENIFVVHMPEQYRGGAKEILAGHLTKTFFPVTLDMIAADIDYITHENPSEEFGNYTVDFLLANHPTKTAIYKIKLNGYSIVFAPDNELPLETTPVRFTKKFEEFISGCDLLIHDAQFCLNNYHSKMNWGHSAWERVVEIAKGSGVKRLYLTHHDPDSSDDYLDEISAQVNQYLENPFMDIKVVKEGTEVSLPVKERAGMKG